MVGYTNCISITKGCIAIMFQPYQNSQAMIDHPIAHFEGGDSNLAIKQEEDSFYDINANKLFLD
jgi:hypothetical protein